MTAKVTTCSAIIGCNVGSLDVPMNAFVKLNSGFQPDAMQVFGYGENEDGGGTGVHRVEEVSIRRDGGFNGGHWLIIPVRAIRVDHGRLKARIFSWLPACIRGG